MNFKLKKLTDDIFLLTFDDQIDLAMHFLRYQEYHESPKFAKKPFKIVEYVEWYMKKHDGNFTYAKEWIGFNTPGRAFEDLFHNDAAMISDWNKYDDFMLGIYKLMKGSCSSRFYLIGCLMGDEETLDHEIAHSLYYTNIKYQIEQDELLTKYRENVRVIREWLINEGYSQHVSQDEAQAYLSTGLPQPLKSYMKKNKVSFQNVANEFKKVFEKYKGTIKQ